MSATTNSLVKKAIAYFVLWMCFTVIIFSIAFVIEVSEKGGFFVIIPALIGTFLTEFILGVIILMAYIVNHVHDWLKIDL